ncbi:unnamed protein product, partial [Mesorhabditis spiculigera]
MERVPVYVAADGETAAGAGDSASYTTYHTLDGPYSPYYTTSADGIFTTAGSSKGTIYTSRRKYIGDNSTIVVADVVDPVTGESQTIGTQIHHLQPVDTDEEPYNMDTYYIGRDNEEQLIDNDMPMGHRDRYESDGRLYLAQPKSLFEIEEERRLRHAENSRLRYHRMSEEKRKAVNQRRAERIKTARQRNKEVHELETILKDSNDIESSQHDIDQQEEARQRRVKQRRADAARIRYHKMTEAQRKEYNMRRRFRQLGLDPDFPVLDDEKVQAKLREVNQKKAQAARNRYHAMSEEERRQYNARRTAAFRKRRNEEEQLLNTPAGKISAMALEKAHKIMCRNARKAEAARLRYQRMSHDERREFNIRRNGTRRSGRLTEDENSLDASLETTAPEPSSSSDLYMKSMPTIEQPDRNVVMVEDVPVDESETDPADIVVDDDDINVDLETFEETERDIDSKTKLAQCLLTQKAEVKAPSNLPRCVYVTSELVTDPQGKETLYLQPAPGQGIDEKQLKLMLEHECDETGRLFEIRTMDGKILLQKPSHALDESIKPYNPMDVYNGDRSEYYDDKVEKAKKRRAEKARERYHKMSDAAKAEFNSRRAETLRKARKRDEDLIQLASTTPLSTMDEETKKAVLDAQRRRQKRAMQAREKYHRMNSEERRQYNAMRDAQRRQRKREQEGKTLTRQGDESGGELSREGVDDHQDEDLFPEFYDDYDDPATKY